MPNIHLRYLNHHLSRQLNELYISTVIFAFGQSIITLFIPIYLYQLGFSLLQILGYFVLHYASYAILMLPVGKIINKTGYEAAIGWSMPLYGLYLASLFLIPNYGVGLFYASSIIWALYKSIYWPAFHGEFAHFSNTEALGEEISSLKVLAGMVSILGPTIGGFILVHSGFTAIFAIVMLLSFASLIPLLISKEKYNPEKYSIKIVIKSFTKKIYRKDIIANLGTGEDTIAQVVWPIFLLMILNNYQDVGVITTIALFIAFIMILVMGKLANNPSRQGLIRITSSILSLSWIIRIFAFNWISLFATDTIYKISKRTLNVPVQALIYSRPDKANVLNYIIFREICLSIGKIFSGIIAFFIIYITGEILLTFVAASIIALFYFYWSDKLIEEKLKKLK